MTANPYKGWQFPPPPSTTQNEFVTVDYDHGYNAPADLCNVNAEAVIVGTVIGVSGSRWDTANGMIPPTETAQQAINSFLVAYNVLEITNIHTLRTQDSVPIHEYVEIDTRVGTIGYTGIDLAPGTYLMAIEPGTTVPISTDALTINPAGSPVDQTIGVVRAAFSVDSTGNVAFPTTTAAANGHDEPGKPEVVPLSAIERGLGNC